MFLFAGAQSEKYLRFTLYNTQTAMPFGKFTGLFSSVFHPFAETGIGKKFSARKNQHWFTEFRLGYFYHRFVQHGIPVTLNIGYQYQFKNRFSLHTSIGGGYLHAIPATEKLRADENGEYHNNKKLGRMQATVNFDIGGGYELNLNTKKNIRIFFNYRQMLQMPFVRSYVPLLPYNSFGIGISKPFH